MKSLRALALLSLVPLAGLVACPDGDGEGSGGAIASGGAGGAGGGAGADAGLVWDPVWHQTQPKQWPTQAAPTLPDCGDGCRIAMKLPLKNPAVFGHRFTEKRLASDSPLGVAVSQVGDATTFALPNPKGQMGRSSLWGDHISYLRSFGSEDGQVEVANLITGETKVAFRYLPETSITSVSRTVMGPRHVFWVFAGGLWSRNLKTGEVKNPGGFCFSYCATDSAVLCDAGRIKSIDPDSGKQTYLDYGGAWQTHGVCSPARTQYVWIDYRDPPGPGSTEFNRSGGEVYTHNLATNKTLRITFDSPAAPRGKVHPAVDGNWVVWNEPSDGKPPNPDSLSELKSASKTLAKFDMKTGKRCRLTSRLIYLGYKSLHGTHLYGTWLDNQPGGEAWLVDLDLEHPSLTWECVDTPQWKG